MDESGIDSKEISPYGCCEPSQRFYAQPPGYGKKTERVFEKSGSFHGVGCPTEAKGGQAMEATTPAYPTRLSETQWETLAV